MTPESLRRDVFQALAYPDRLGRPKYQRLVDALVEAFRRGVWRPGDRLPPEEDLTQLTPYSLGTVQRALRALAEQGLVVRQHGLGSFVADRPRQLQDPWHCRFLADDQAQILPVYSKALQRVTVEAPGPWSQWLGPQASVMQLDRVIDVNNEFHIFTRFYADRHLLKKLWDMPLDKLHGANFKQLIVRQCQLPVTEITHFVRIAPFDDEACERVDVPTGSQGLYLQAVAHAGRDRCIYYQEFFVGRTQRAMKFPETTLSSL